MATAPASGTLSGTPPSLTYTPAPNFNGADNFTFTVNDGTDDGCGVVSITVCPQRMIQPVAVLKRLTTAEDAPLSITLSGSDVEAVRSRIPRGLPGHGTLTGTAPNLLTPAPDFSSADGFTFTFGDGTTDQRPRQQCRST